MTALAPTLQAFFTDRLIRQRHASRHTIAAYRDTLPAAARFAAHRTGTPPSRLDIADLDAPLIAAFLDHLEHDRGNSIRTRNARLAAIHSLFRYAALRHPEHAADIAPRPGDPTETLTTAPIVTFLTEPETEALLAAPDRATWIGRRDHTILIAPILRTPSPADRTRPPRRPGWQPSGPRDSARPHRMLEPGARAPRPAPRAPPTRTIITSSVLD